MKILDKINSPKDLKTLERADLNVLAEEMRAVLLKKLSVHGGHFGPNFGFVEATIALHYVFDSPTDKIVYDVSHQSYPHKMLTGRKDAFIYEDKYDDVTGYTNPDESEHDFFKVGHTSTALSLAAGLAKARDLKDEKYNVIAVVGDGSLSGGEALEALDYAGEAKGNLIILINDNDMSIAENHGGIYKNLKLLRDTEGKAELNLFKSMGLNYVFVKNGNDIDSLINAFESVKGLTSPVVVHVVTEKGKGYKFAEENKEAWHWTMPFDVKTGKRVSFGGESYEELTGKYLLNKMKSDPAVVAITAAVPMVFGFTPERRKLAGAQYVDVGIAEEHGVALASGIAKNGGKPVFATQASFIQRTYDQLSQDVCINKSPAVILVNTASVYAMNDVTHLGLYDIPLISNIPEMVYLAPTCKQEYFAMLDYAIEQKDRPVAIRMPCNGVIESDKTFDTDYSVINKFKVDIAGEKVAVIALGDFYQLGEELVKSLSNELNINATLINPRFASGIDERLLGELKRNHSLVVTLEDGSLSGGFGEKVASFYGDTSVRVKNFGVKKAFYDRFDLNELLIENNLTLDLMTKAIANILNVEKR